MVASAPRAQARTPKKKPPAPAPAPEPTPEPAPAPPPEDTGKQDARSLMASGVSLLQAKDYRAALAIFKEGYQRYPSAKFLLNIGTTLKALGRNAEAANAYQRYLDAPDTDATRQREITDLLGTLDATVGKLAIAITPVDAEVMVGDSDWMTPAEARFFRVDPGEVEVRGRCPGYLGKTVEVTARLGTSVDVSLALEEKKADVGEVIVRDAGPGRWSAIAHVHVDAKLRGAAAVVGAGVLLADRVHVTASALLGATPGAMPAATVHLLRGRLRPYVTLALPVFFSSGARVSARAAVGAMLRVGRRLEFVLEAAGERALNPEGDIDDWAVVPAAGTHVRF